MPFRNFYESKLPPSRGFTPTLTSVVSFFLSVEVFLVFSGEAVLSLWEIFTKVSSFFQVTLFETVGGFFYAGGGEGLFRGELSSSSLSARFES